MEVLKNDYAERRRWGMMELYFQIKAIGTIIGLIIMGIFLIIGIVLMIWGSRKK